MDYSNYIIHNDRWWWGASTTIIRKDGMGSVCVKYDEKSFPTVAYICDLTVHISERRKGYGEELLRIAINEGYNNNMKFARLHVDRKNIWLRQWYEKFGFNILSQDANEYEMVKEL